MEILLYKDLIINFISKNVLNGEHLRLIRKILDNENSKYLYSKKGFQFIEEELGEDYQQEFQALFTKLSDNGLSIKSSESSSTFDEEFLHIYQSIRNNVFITISYTDPNELIIQSVPNIAILSKQVKPNYHWLVTQIAILHPNTVTINCFNFVDNNQINQFFADMFKIPKRISRINILTRQTREFNQDKFCFDIKTIPVYYYTYQHKNFHLDEADIRAFFRRVKIFITRKLSELHGRRIIFDGFVLSSDHDFNELEAGGDWKIDIQFSSSDCQNWLARCNKFRELR
jgi:hypothetical protein